MPLQLAADIAQVSLAWTADPFGHHAPVLPVVGTGELVYALTAIAAMHFPDHTTCTALFERDIPT